MTELDRILNQHEVQFEDSIMRKIDTMIPGFRLYVVSSKLVQELMEYEKEFAYIKLAKYFVFPKYDSETDSYSIETSHCQNIEKRGQIKGFFILDKEDRIYTLEFEEISFQDTKFIINKVNIANGFSRYNSWYEPIPYKAVMASITFGNHCLPLPELNVEVKRMNKQGQITEILNLLQNNLDHPDYTPKYIALDYQIKAFHYQELRKRGYEVVLTDFKLFRTIIIIDQSCREEIKNLLHILHYTSAT